MLRGCISMFLTVEADRVNTGDFVENAFWF